MVLFQLISILNPQLCGYLSDHATVYKIEIIKNIFYRTSKLNIQEYHKQNEDKLKDLLRYSNNLKLLIIEFEH